MALLKRLKRSVTVVLVRALSAGLNKVPRSLATFVGSVLGLTAFRLLPRDRYRIVRHLSLVYGDSLSHREKERIARRFFINSGRNLTDVIRFRDHFDDEITSLVDVEGMEHFDAAYRRGKGLVSITGHLGNFELGAAYVAGLGYKLAVIGRQMYDSRLDELLVGNRETRGLTNIATNDSPRRFYRWLKDGGAVGVLIDIDSIRVRSIFVPVFGRSALTPVGQTLIGLKADAAFVPMACVRTPSDRYRLIVRPEVRIERTGDIDRDAWLMTAACSAALEQLIDEYRDQWIWLKNRWLTSPRDHA